MRVTYDPGFEYEYAENVDQELMAEEELACGGDRI